MVVTPAAVERVSSHHALPARHVDAARLHRHTRYLHNRTINQSINQSINLYCAIVQRHVLQCGYAESKRNVLKRILNVLTDGAVRQFSGQFPAICRFLSRREAMRYDLKVSGDRS